MRNSGVEIFAARDCEAKLLIKPERMRLGAEFDFTITALVRRRQQFHQQRPANSVLSPLRQHSHAADMRVGQQSSGAHGLA